MLKVHGLCFGYLDKPLFVGIDLRLLPGKLLHIQADNGTGKTTFLRLLAGLLEPEAGDILWGGQSIYQHLQGYHRQLSYVGHSLGLDLDLTVAENCFFGAYGQPRRLASLLEQFALAPFADVLCGQLSAGQKRRVALLRLLMSNARLWLLDEPYAALDNASQGLLNQAIVSHLNDQGMVVMTSHQAVALPADYYEAFYL